MIEDYDSDDSNDNGINRRLRTECGQQLGEAPVRLDGSQRGYDNVVKSSKMSIQREIEKDPNAIMYNEEDEPENIGDLSKLMDTTMDIIQFMDTAPMTAKLRLAPSEFEDIITAKYGEQCPPQLIDLLIEDKKNKSTKNFEKMIQMFSTLVKVKEGEADMTTEYNAFTEEINSEYVYPKFGGKEEFNKAMMKEAKRKARKEMKRQSRK